MDKPLSLWEWLAQHPISTGPNVEHHLHVSKWSGQHIDIYCCKCACWPQKDGRYVVRER